MTITKWINKGIDHKELEGTNFSIRKVIFNGNKVWQVKNFNTVIGMADTFSEAKQIVKYEGGK